MDRVNYYFRQLVTEADMDGAFDDVENRFGNERLDLDDARGVAFGLIVTEDPAGPNLNVQVTAGTAHQKDDGVRVPVASLQLVDMSVDEGAASTLVTVAGEVKWLSLFVKADRVLSDPKVDGHGNVIQYQRTESFAFVVRQGAQGVAPARPALDASYVLLADVELDITNVITNAQISTTRRELRRDRSVAIHEDGTASKHDADEIDDEAVGGFHGANVQQTLTALDIWLDAHMANDAASKHDADVIDDETVGGYHGINTQLTLDNLATGLDAHEADDALEKHDADQIDDDTAGGYHAGTAQATLDALDTALVAHENGAASKHDASEIDDETQGQSVQASIDALYARGSYYAWGEVELVGGPAIKWKHDGAAADIKAGEWSTTRPAAGEKGMQRVGLGRWVFYLEPETDTADRIHVQVTPLMSAAGPPIIAGEERTVRNANGFNDFEVNFRDHAGNLADPDGCHIAVTLVP